MEDVEFEWNDVKAESNLKKHGVSFEEGATIFNDPEIATIFDPDHSKDEERLISIGTSIQGILLVIAHTERGERMPKDKLTNSFNQLQKSYENK